MVNVTDPIFLANYMVNVVIPCPDTPCKYMVNVVLP